MIKIKPLEWSEPTPPNEERQYDHIIARGAWTYCIEWKSWKPHDVYVINRKWENTIKAAVTLDGAKQIAQEDYERLVRSALVHDGPVGSTPETQPEHSEIAAKRYASEETDIDTAIRHALKFHPLFIILRERRSLRVTTMAGTEHHIECPEDSHMIAIAECHSVKPFVMAVLRDLGMIQ